MSDDQNCDDPINNHVFTVHDKNGELGNSFRSLVGNKLLSDVTFVVSDGRIPAHRQVLCCRSEVFRAMFTGGLQETAAPTVEIVEDTPCTVEHFTQFMMYVYTGSCETNINSCHSLLVLSKKYAFSCLSEHTAHLLIKHLSVDTAVESYTLARQYDATVLEQDCKDFIATHIMQFTRLPFSVFEQVVANNNLALSELDLFLYILRYAKSADEELLQQNGGEPEDGEDEEEDGSHSNVVADISPDFSLEFEYDGMPLLLGDVVCQRVVEPLMPHVRWECMDFCDLRDFVRPSGLLSHTELLDIFELKMCTGISPPCRPVRSAYKQM
eukprot:NODE_819_length_1313_cov_374.648734_g622_i0.p1 GENE.NODE_819_length_1313_cov_374.648734_g622_i0~~NODE_819_length_1313_cov_374.648734_g622_i0.p1  ORF type:complete len:325 (+),score=60.52 NODE_819_length_1313_cov_374.648734_g622_i0:100-1074(+)